MVFLSWLNKYSLDGGVGFVEGDPGWRVMVVQPLV